MPRSYFLEHVEDTGTGNTCWFHSSIYGCLKLCWRIRFRCELQSRKEVRGSPTIYRFFNAYDLGPIFGKPHDKDIFVLIGSDGAL